MAPSHTSSPSEHLKALACPDTCSQRSELELPERVGSCQPLGNARILSSCTRGSGFSPCPQAPGLIPQTHRLKPLIIQVLWGPILTHKLPSTPWPPLTDFLKEQREVSDQMVTTFLIHRPHSILRISVSFSFSCGKIHIPWNFCLHCF